MRFVRIFLFAIFLPGLMLVGAASLAFYFVNNKTQLKPAPVAEKIWQVEAVTARYRDETPRLKLYGEVAAGRQVELRALVGGEIVKVHGNFAEGGSVAAGELLVAVAPFDYEIALAERQAQQTEAHARLEEILARQMSLQDSLVRDREQRRLLKRSLDRVTRLYKRGNTTDRSVDTAKLDLSRQKQVITSRENELKVETARLAQQKAALQRLAVQIRKAERDLRQVSLLAPYSGVLVDINAEIGKRIGTNDRIARLIDLDRLDVRFHLSDAQFGRLVSGSKELKGRSVEVIWQTGSHRFNYKAKIERLAPNINAASGGVDILPD